MLKIHDEIYIFKDVGNAYEFLPNNLWHIITITSQCFNENKKYVPRKSWMTKSLIINCDNKRKLF